MPHVTFDAEGRYTPVKKGEVFGIVIVRNKKPDEPEELVERQKLVTGSGAAPADDEPEPEPPAPFQWTEEVKN